MTKDKKRAELNLHTKMSKLDGLIAPEDVFALAETYGLSAVAITDFNSVQAFPELYKQAQKCGSDTKIIYGAEIRCRIPADGTVLDLSVLVQNQAGLKNLYKIISAIEADETVDFTYMLAHREGLLFGWSCRNQTDCGEVACDYIEIHPADEQKNKALMERLKKTNDQTPVVAVSNARYTEKKEGLWREGLRAQWELENNDPEHILFLRTTDEILTELAYLGEDTACKVVIDNPNQIADMIEPVMPIPEGQYLFELPNAVEELCGICRTRAETIYGLPLPVEVENRLSTELTLILENHFESYYMLAQKLVAHAHSLGYHTGTRASVASSFAAHLLGISEVNPLPPHYICPKCKHSEFITDGSVDSGFDLLDKPCPVCGETMRGDGHNIPFEVFMGLKGERKPDIDLNVPEEIQDQMVAFLVHLVGEEHLVRGGTIRTTNFQRILEPVADYVEKRRGAVWSAEAEVMSEKLSCVKRGEGVHPVKYFILPAEREIFDLTPVRRDEDDRVKAITHFQAYDLADTFQNIDILCHPAYSMLAQLEQFTGVSPSRAKINEPEIYKLIRDEYVYHGVNIGPSGIGEFSTPFARDLVQKLRPKSFSDLVKISGFAHGTNAWNGNGEELFASGTAPLRELIATRDDVFLTLQKHGVEREKAYRIMEIVRKGKSRQLLTEQDARDLRAHGIPSWYIKSCKKIWYLFTKAHVVEYVLAAVRLAWYKIHYPVEFYAAYYSTKLANLHPGISLDDMVYKECCLRLEIEFLPPNEGKSDKKLFLPEHGNIRMPLRK